jgi:hypothetical protein
MENKIAVQPERPHVHRWQTIPCGKQRCNDCLQERYVAEKFYVQPGAPESKKE